MVADSVGSRRKSAADLTRWPTFPKMPATAHTGGTLAIHASQLLVLPGPRFKAAEFMRQARAALSAKFSG